MAQYLKNTKTGREFKIISVDNEKGTITLKGEYSQFTEPFDKKRFKENGYTLIEKAEKKVPAMADADEDDDE